LQGFKVATLISPLSGPPTDPPWSAV